MDFLLYVLFLILGFLIGSARNPDTPQLIKPADTPPEPPAPDTIKADEPADTPPEPPAPDTIKADEPAEQAGEIPLEPLDEFTAGPIDPYEVLPPATGEEIPCRYGSPGPGDDFFHPVYADPQDTSPEPDTQEVDETTETLLPRFQGRHSKPRAQQEFLTRNLTTVEWMLCRGKTSAEIMDALNVTWNPFAEFLVTQKMPTPQAIRGYLTKQPKSQLDLSELYRLGEELRRKHPLRYARSHVATTMEYITVISMLKKGMSVADMKEVFGCATSTVYEFLRKHDLPTPTSLTPKRKNKGGRNGHRLNK